MNKSFIKTLPLLIIPIVLVILAGYYFNSSKTRLSSSSGQTITPTPQVTQITDPLQIDQMRKRSYPGSQLVIEQTLANGSNYHQYIASYNSDGLKIYGLLTVPISNPPENGWPAIIFNHGYIPPNQYQTTERYVAYVDYFARNGYIVFKSDYRGNGNSEGQPEGAYYSPAYAIDVLNALASVKQLPEVNPAKIGMWGHSLGGNITLRSLVLSPDIKAAVIWGGVVGSYDDLINNWHRRVSYQPPPYEMSLRNRSRTDLFNKYGTLDQNPIFWHSIDPTFYLNDISAPVQLDSGSADEEVPVAFSQQLNDSLVKLGKNVEFYTYPGADHNISGASFNLAMARSLAFFDKYLKN